MWLFLLFSTAVVQATNISLTEDYFVSFVKKYPVKSICPCDDFYAHVCSAVPTGEMSYFHKSKRIFSLFNLDDYRQLKMQSILEAMKEVFKSDEKNATDEASVKDRVEQLCFKNPQQCRDYTAVIEMDPWNVTQAHNLKECTNILTKTLVKLFSLDESLTVKLLETFKHITDLHAFLRGLQDPKNQKIKEQFVLVQSKTEAMFDQIKKAYLERIMASPWVHDRDLFDHYISIAAVEFRSYFWNSGFEEFSETVVRVYEKCAQLSFAWYKKELLFCAIKAFTVAHEKANLPWFHQEGLDMNAAYINGDIAVMPTYMMVATYNEIASFAVLNFVVGHEVAHHIFADATNISTLMPENVECLKKHRAHVCNISSPKCWSGTITAVEDAPDVTSLAILTDLFNEAKHGFKMHPSLTMSKEKFLFYSMVADWCLPPDAVSWGNSHSRSKERMNSLLMHSKFFHETFECKRGDKMWQDPDNFCNLLGPGSHRK